MSFLTIVQIILFIGLVGASFFVAFRKFKEIYDNIMLGKPEHINTTLGFRIKNMLLIALGQKKMFKLTFAALLHMVIYVSFVITQIELIEIFIDGLVGSHRILYHAFENIPFLHTLYVVVINFIEVLSLLTFFVTILFILRRTTFKVERFQKPELKGWPWRDALTILAFELILISFIFLMNGADSALHIKEHGEGYGFILSGFFGSMLTGLPNLSLELLEKLGWWGHLCMVMTFLVYLPYSKHLHIMLAFPNTFFSRPEAKGEIHNMPAIQHEVQSMLDPSFVVPATDGEIKFGAKDVYDLSWKSLLDAYTCTECGRCTAACPANQTGKKLSPRKIMMDTRDRMEDISKGKKEHGPDFADNKSLLGDYITGEELRACTTCNACVEECPVNISPLSIIIELRRNLIMEASDSPTEWNNIFANLENNQAPWQFSPSDRLNWTEELN
ncbi:MAG: (Fe-S)-binding protein [Sphingobacteriales bacterium]|nr:(Fe-S)-binding protein [Sphingobacteriales bacterium]